MANRLASLPRIDDTDFMFELWVRRDLRARYSAILEEDVPADLLRLAVDLTGDRDAPVTALAAS